MKINASALIILLSLIYVEAYSCKCSQGRIENELEKANDIVIGKVISEKQDQLACNEYGTDYSYEFNIEFSYKDQLHDNQKIFGGKGGGGCGAIFQNGYKYVIVVYKCDGGFYSSMCSDNNLLSSASNQVSFLNKYFKKNYKDSKLSLLMSIVLVCLAITLGGLVTVNQYKKRWVNRN